MQTKEGAIST